MELKDFLIPAIDLKEGKLVRLFRGDFSKSKVYPYGPSEVAKLFSDKGFSRLHVVDLDGAKEGKPYNLEVLRDIRKNFKGKIQFGGGVRSYEIAKILFEEGIDFVMVGTMAVRDREEFERIIGDFPERVILSIDSKGGKVAVGGWKEESLFSPKELVDLYDPLPLWGYLYTIVERDGSLEGVDPAPYIEIKKYTSKPVIASGGVSSLEDVERLMGIVDHVVAGKAIYEGKIPLLR